MIDTPADSTRLSLSLLTDTGIAISSETEPQRMLHALVEICARGPCAVAIGYLDDAGTIPLAVASQVPFEASRFRTLALVRLDRETARNCGLLGFEVLPLIVKGLRLGTLVLGLASEVDSTVRATLQTVATLAAASIGLAQAHANQRDIADRLQQAMLPLELPAREDIRFYSAYRPATDDTLVGGDWYDAFDIGDGRIGFSIGDVTGHGLEAAVAMVEVRLAIRAATASSSSPASVLETVNRAVPLAASVGAATAIAGDYDPRTRTIRYATAGHPPPLYVGADRRVLALRGGGLPLGIGLEVGSADTIVTLDPGASIVLYTDGLLEYNRDILAGEVRLREALSFPDVANADDPARALQETILSDVGNSDDVAVLTIRSQVARSDALHLRYSSEPACAIIARSAIANYLIAQQVAADPAHRILTACGEAIANAIEHGAHEPATSVTITIDRSADELHVAVESEGHWKRSAAHSDERGRGIAMMRALARNVLFTSTKTSTIARLSFDVSAA